jgi:hypothetical protein
MFWILALLTANAFVGYFLFEKAWAATARHRMRDEARDNLFPAWRRHDAWLWKKSTFYPIAVTLLPLRLFICIGSIFVVYAFNKVVLYGEDLSKPLPGYKKFFCKRVLAICSFIICLTQGTLITVKRHEEADYS